MTERRKVIALVTDAIGPYHRGGKERRYLELAHRLANRAEVHVYTMNWWRGGAIRHDRGVTYHAISPLLPLYSGPRRSIRQAVVFAVCCLRLLFVRFDVIEADHMPYLQLLTLRLIATLRRRRLVVTWHECWGPDIGAAYLGRAGAVGWFFERVAMRLPDTIIADLPQTAERLRELGCRVPIVVSPSGSTWPRSQDRRRGGGRGRGHRRAPVAAQAGGPAYCARWRCCGSAAGRCGR